MTKKERFDGIIWIDEKDPDTSPAGIRTDLDGIKRSLNLLGYLVLRNWWDSSKRSIEKLGYMAKGILLEEYRRQFGELKFSKKGRPKNSGYYESRESLIDHARECHDSNQPITQDVLAKKMDIDLSTLKRNLDKFNISWTDLLIESKKDV